MNCPLSRDCQRRTSNVSNILDLIVILKENKGNFARLRNALSNSKPTRQSTDIQSSQGQARWLSQDSDYRPIPHHDIGLDCTIILISIRKHSNIDDLTINIIVLNFIEMNQSILIQLN